jgi:signal transduction histidine kinase
MRKETDRINRIIRDLLDFARPGGPSDGKAQMTGFVESAIHDTTTLLGPQKSFKELELEVHVESDLPMVPLANERLMQVLLNLLLNAADACDGSGKIELRAEHHERGVRLSVTDNGPGVAADVRQTLFEPFVTTKEVGHGTGLGLSVCRGLVEAAGGTLSLDEGYHPGARFVIELPAA